jgi:GNAT superfamily N-acetyltransferase
MAHIIIREGTYSDNEELVNLTSLTPMKGNISLRIDRNPDFFRLLELRGPSFVIVAESDHQLIGSYSASAVNVFISGQPETVYYLADFKVHPDYRNLKIAVRLAKAMLQKLDDINADLLFCTAAFGNADVMPFLKGRASLPLATEVGMFRVMQIIPTPIRKRSNKYLLAEEPIISSTVSFFNDFMKNYQLAPVHSESSFENNLILTASFKSELVAAIALFDTASAKQNVVIRLPFILKSIVAFTNIINTVYPLLRLPETNKAVKILYIKEFGCKPGHDKALKLLIAKARNLAYEKKYTFLSIGIHQKDPLSKVFSRYPKFIFKSMGFLASLKGNNEKINNIIRGIPFEDYSLV